MQPYAEGCLPPRHFRKREVDKLLEGDPALAPILALGQHPGKDDVGVGRGELAVDDFILLAQLDELRTVQVHPHGAASTHRAK